MLADNRIAEEKKHCKINDSSYTSECFNLNMLNESTRDRKITTMAMSAKRGKHRSTDTLIVHHKNYLYTCTGRVGRILHENCEKYVQCFH